MLAEMLENDALGYWYAGAMAILVLVLHVAFPNWRGTLRGSKRRTRAPLPPEAQVRRHERRASNARTSHVLHLLLSLLTLGLWIPVWMLAGLSNAVERSRAEAAIGRIERRAASSRAT